VEAFEPSSTRRSPDSAEVYYKPCYVVQALTTHNVSVQTSQETHYVSVTDRLMLFKETVPVYCENHTKHTDTVHTSQETHYVSATKTNILMLFEKTVAVYCENHTEHRYSSYLTGNTLRLRYRDQPVNDV
jgi:thioredoxin-related protein